MINFKKQQHSVGKTSQIMTRTTNSEPIHVDYLSTFSSVNIKILAAKTCVMKAVRLFDGHAQAWRFFTCMDLQEVFVVVYPHRHGAVHTTVSLPTVADRILRVFASAVFVARKCFLRIFKSTDLVVHFCLHYYECSRLFSQGSIYVIL